MVSIGAILACAVTLLISLVLPLVVLLVFARKHRKQGILSAWLLGAAGFFVPQILIRLPVLTFLQGQSWFAAFAQSNLFLYAFTLAFTAGLFELAGRFGAAKVMERNLTRNRSLAAGLGHGGIEAILIVGMTYVNNLLYMILINTGYFDTITAQTAALGMDTSQLELIRTQLIGTSPVLFLLAGFERLLAMTGHLAMSALICYGVAKKKNLPCVLLCLGIHTLIDLTAGISLALPQRIAYPIIYALLTAVAAASLLVLNRLDRRWTTPVNPPEAA